MADLHVWTDEEEFVTSARRTTEMSNERSARIDAWASEAVRAHRRYHGTRKRRNAIRRATRRHGPWAVTVEDARETFAGVFGAEALATFDALMAETAAT